MPAGALIVLDRVDHLCDISKAKRPTIAVCDYEIAPGLRFTELGRDLDGEPLVRSREGADRRMSVGSTYGTLHLVHADAARRQGQWIKLDAHCILLAA